MTFARPFFLLAAAALASLPGIAFADPIAIAEVKHEGEVDFEKEILPIFRRNCLACHSATEAQSDLVLESPQTILKGGSEGPAVMAGKSAESLLLALAAQQKEPHMPPPDNDVKAKSLTPDELGLIKLWIDQGAKGEVQSASSMITWQPLPPGINPIYAVAIAPDGQYAAAARANQIFLYHVPSRRELGRLTDPALLERGLYKQPGVADVDLIQALRFSPDGQWLASGGYRTVKLWKKPAGGKKLDLAGLEGPARSIAVSNDGKWAAIGEETGKAKVFDLTTGQVVKTLQGHGGPVTGVAFTADGARLVTGSLDKTFRVFNLADQAQLASIETPAAVNAVAIVGEGKLVATGGEDSVIRTWELPAMQPAEAAKPVKELAGHSGAITSLAALAPSGVQLLSGSKDGTVRVWDVANGNVVKNMNHGSPVEAVAARADGKRFAAVSSANNAKLWNGENQQQVAEMKGDFRAALQVAEVGRAAALAKKHVELAGNDLKQAGDRKKAEEENQTKSKEALTKAEAEFKTKDEATKQPTADKEAADKALADATANKPKADEAKVAMEAAFKTADDVLKVAKTAQDAAVKTATDGATAAKAAADQLAAAKESLAKDAENQGLKDALAAAEKASQEAEAAKKTADEGKAAADKAFADADAARKTAETNKQAADKAAQDAVAALKAAEEKLKQVMPVYQKAIDERTTAERTLQTSQRGVERAGEAVTKATEAVPGFETIVKQLETVVQTRDQEVLAATNAAKETEKPLKGVAFSPDGLTLATVGDDQLLHTWDAETGAAVEVVGGAGAALNVVAFTAEGSAITAAANNTGAIWDFATEWQLARTIGSPDMDDVLVDRATALDFSPDGKLLAVGGGEPSRSGEIKLFNVESGELVLALKEPHSDTVNCLQFSPDGSQLASCAADRFVKIWNVADGAFVRSFEGHTHHVLGVAWRQDGRMLVSSGADMVLKVWDTRTGDQLRTVQNQFTKEVTSVQFVGDGDLVVATSGDHRVRLVNAANGSIARDFPGPADYMYSGAASADGKTILAGGLDSVLRIWNDQGQEQAKFVAPAAAPQTAAN
ncbi:MAG: c-type cytochrome domain-containing protein [Pirellulaceae bacterium]